MKDWQQRVVDEEIALKKTCIALDSFLDSAVYDDLILVEQAKLTTQVYFMLGYLGVLIDRIDNF